MRRAVRDQFRARQKGSATASRVRQTPILFQLARERLPMIQNTTCWSWVSDAPYSMKARSALNVKRSAIPDEDHCLDGDAAHPGEHREHGRGEKGEREGVRSDQEGSDPRNQGDSHHDRERRAEARGRGHAEGEGIGEADCRGWSASRPLQSRASPRPGSPSARPAGGGPRRSRPGRRPRLPRSHDGRKHLGQRESLPARWRHRRYDGHHQGDSP